MDDVADHARARWNDLVRTLVSLGDAVDEAERTAATALARTWTSWARERREGDVDVLVYAALLRARPAGSPLDPPAAGRVLMAGAGLSAYQAEQALGTAVDEPLHGVAPLVAEQWDDLYRGQAPTGAIEQSVRRRRRRTRLAVAGGVAVVLVASAVGWAVGRDDAPAPPPGPDPAVRANPIALAWWTDGTLHLGARTVAAPGLRTLAQAGSGTGYAVVFGARTGAVSQVDADGTVTALGHQSPGARLVGSPDSMLVAWVDPGDGGDPCLVVWDTATHRLAGALTLHDAGSAPEPTSIDGRDVVFSGPPTGSLRWTLGDAAARPMASVDVGQRDPHEQSDTDGALTATWTPGQTGVRLTSLASRPVPPQPSLPAGEYVSDVRFAPDGALVVVAVRYYLISIGSPRDLEGGGGGRTAQSDLFTCGPATGACGLAAGRVTSGGSNGPLVLAD